MISAVRLVRAASMERRPRSESQAALPPHRVERLRRPVRVLALRPVHRRVRRGKLPAARLHAWCQPAVLTSLFTCWGPTAPA